MNKKLDLSGKRFGILKAIRPISSSTNGNSGKHIVWLCICDCGNYHTTISSSLRRGITTSCGCLKIKRLTKHGGKGSPLYSTWKTMRQRCFNQNNPKYRRYGKRGINICEEWENFINFREWAIEMGYKERMTIDRINNDEIYSPDNCQWLSKSDHAIKSHIDVPQVYRFAWINGKYVTQGAMRVE